MASTFAVNLAGKTAKPYGAGMRVVAGQMDLAFAGGVESVAAKDVGLKRLYYLHVSPGTTTDRYIQTNIGAPGTMDNLATVTVFAAGSQTALDGTLEDVSFLAIGE